jgi:beta-lactamase class A
MLETMRKIALADVLSTQSREQIIAWMVASKTGAKRLRAGLPKDWRVGDKTGTGSNGEANDIAVIWPARGAPVLVTAYYAGAKRQEDEGNAVLAEVGRIVAGATAKPA